jgi:hypothetical protein
VYEPRRILEVVQHFVKYCTCHPQGNYVLVRPSWASYIEQEVGGALDVMELIGGAEELLAVHKTTKIDKPVHMYPEDGN